MTDNVNFFAPRLEAHGAEHRLRSLRRRFREAGRANREPFTTAQLALLAVAVFLAILSIGVFGVPIS
jgi:hypothetical protein